ncbi:MAG: tellurite resistance TerB family protein [Beijerinckiaceae bacterium]|jgi:uncharacterized membrane protein YebE (DUF533 family)|nr:tellurite resistance TerB family protein [Beijerinckiaceae bacterium]
MDATKLIEQLLGGAQGQQSGQASSGQAGGLGGLLGSLLGGSQSGQPGQAGQESAQSGGLGGLLGGLASSLGGQNAQSGAQSGGLGGLLGGLASSLGGQSGSTQPAQGSAGGIPGGLGGLLSQLNNAGGGLGGLAAGGLMGMLAGRSGGLGGLAKIGGVAAIGMLAHNAFKSWQASQGQAAPAQPDLPQQLAAPAADGHPFAFTLVQAMISAANADGKIDADEQKAIAAQIEKLDLDDEGRAFIRNSLENPLTASQVAALADGPEQGAQIYLMARVAINPDEPVEQAYLKELAGDLGVPNELMAHLESQITGTPA